MSEVFDYDEITAVANELLQFFGRKVDLRQNVTAAANSTTPWRGKEIASGLTITDADCAFVDMTVEQRNAAGSVQQTDKVAIIAAQSSEITTDWEILDKNSGGKRWKIIEILNQVEPGPQIVIYILQVRI